MLSNGSIVGLFYIIDTLKNKTRKDKQMRKIISLALVACMAFSIIPVASATRDYSQGTEVTYVGQSSESYTITVPALMAPGDEGTVTLSGVWPSNRTVTVTADQTVTLVNSINSSDEKVLNVIFPTLAKDGNNEEAKTYTQPISVAAMPADALFGTWSGTFYYNVSVADAVKKPMFSMVHKPTNTVTKPQSTFTIMGCDIRSDLGHSPSMDGGEIFSFPASGVYYAEVNDDNLQLKAQITRDFEAEFYGSFSTANIDSSLLGITAGELCEYAVITTWPDGTGTSIEFTMEEYEVSEGVMLSIPCITYRYLDENGQPDGWSSGPYPIWVYDASRNTFTLAREDIVAEDNMMIYVDGSGIFGDTILDALGN